MKNLLIKKYGDEKRFVNWKLEERKGKQTKVPYSAITGKMASTTDSRTWTTAKEALAKDDHIGIVLHDKLLVCIDIDHVIKNKKIVGEEKEKIAELILEADTYTEISQSGTGLHLFFGVEEALEIAHNKKSPFEVYNNGRYIAVTGNNYGKAREVRVLSTDEARHLIEIAIPQAEPKASERIAQEETHSHFPDDTTLLERMFASKNGEKIKKLCEGDLSEYKGDGSTGDMALCSHLAFWSGKDAAQIERIWMASPLGQRKKTAQRADYRERTIKAAIAKCKQVYTPPPQNDPKLDLLYTIKDDKKNFIVNTENVCRILEHYETFVGRFRYDNFKATFEIRDGEKWRTQDDTDIINIQTEISVIFPPFLKLGKDMVRDAMSKVSKAHQMDSAADWVRSLVWDKKPRLDTWLCLTYGVNDNVYHKAVASNWMKGMVKRIVDPGCKFDYVLVLEGEQGVKKSTSLAVLGGAWHAETTMSTDTKDFFMQFAGKTIIEFSEGETLSRTEVKRMKAIITMQFDRYRMPYERTTQDFPRRCVFAMTTNQTEYLKDETGNRRWLPVKVLKEEADIEWLEANREQLYAEAYARLLSGENAYDFPKEETMREQNARMIADPNLDLVNDWYHNVLKDVDRKDGITIHQVYHDVLHKGFSQKPLGKYDEMTIGTLLKDGLRLVKKRVRVGAAQSIRWFPQEAVPSELQLADFKLEGPDSSFGKQSHF